MALVVYGKTVKIRHCPATVSARAGTFATGFSWEGVPVRPAIFARVRRPAMSLPSGDRLLWESRTWPPHLAASPPPAISRQVTSEGEVPCHFAFCVRSAGLPSHFFFCLLHTSQPQQISLATF